MTLDETPHARQRFFEHVERRRVTNAHVANAKLAERGPRHDGHLLLGGADGTLRALRPDGTEVWRIQLWRPVELGPVALDDGILAIGGNGDLHRYRQ